MSDHARLRLFPSLVALVLMAAATGVAADKNQFYHMQSLCKTHFLQQLYRKIDGAVLQSQNERNLDCVVTFQTHSILQRFMLRFDLLQLDCNDHLFIYDGAHAVGSYKSDLSCRNTKDSVGIIFTRTNFVTLKYVTDSWGTESNGFRLVITAFKGKTGVAEHACEDFRCELRDFCIATDLVCDEVNHCGDGSDEDNRAICTPNELVTVFGISPTALVVAVVSAVLVLPALVGAAICVCRRGTNGRALPASQPQAPNAGSFPLQQMYGWSGAGAAGTTLLKPMPPPYPGGHTMGAMPPLSTLPPGNWAHPAGRLLGYSAARVRLYCQAK